MGGNSLKDDFYVYVYFRLDGRPFLVGKGRGRRIRHHEQCCAKGNDEGNPHKGHIIRQILAIRSDVPKVKICENLTESEAFALERLFITSIGREPHGPLVNMTDGGDGPAGRKVSPERAAWLGNFVRGTTWSPERRAKMERPEVKEAMRQGQRNGSKTNRERGHKRSVESRTKMRIAKLGKPSPLRGVPRPEAHRAALRGSHGGPQTGPVKSGPKGQHWLTDHETGVAYFGVEARHPLDVLGRKKYLEQGCSFN